jgi:hypothetical protein
VHVNFFAQDKESVMDILKLIDKSNGYVFAGIEGNITEFNKIAAAPLNWDYYRYPLPFFFIQLCADDLLRTRPDMLHG